jgi:hypothetical protein
MNARADDSLSQPPLMPEGESAAADRADFAEECQASLKKLGDRVGWQLGIPLITNTKKWGAVYRVDFTMPGPDLAPLINRVMCWRTTSGELMIEVSVGQHIPPLDSAK